MHETQRVDVLVLGSGEAGKYAAWATAKAGLQTAVVERQLIGGSCPNVACLPSKNIIHSAKVAQLCRRGAEFGMSSGPAAVDMVRVRDRKRRMVEGPGGASPGPIPGKRCGAHPWRRALHSPKDDRGSSKLGSSAVLTGDRVFLNVGTRAHVPRLPGLDQIDVLTHVEALELDRVPEHLIVLGGGFVGLELAQAMRRSELA